MSARRLARSSSARALVAATVALGAFAACNAFPDELRARFADGGAAGGGDAAGGPVVEAALLVPDVGTHRALVLTDDTVAWSTTDGASTGFRVRALDRVAGAAPRTLGSTVCPAENGVDRATGYLAAIGRRVVSTNVTCAGWLCAFEPDGSPRCAYGTSGYVRLVGDGAGLVATGSQAKEIFAFATAFDRNIEGEARVATPNLADDGLATLAASASRALWAEDVADAGGGRSGWRVMACPRALDRCTPVEVVRPHAGALVAIVATDTEVFVAATEGLEGAVLRIEVPSGAESVIATSPAAVGGLAVAGDALLFALGDEVWRTPRRGAASPRLVARAGASVSHLAASTDGRTVYLLTAAGVARAELSFLRTPRPRRPSGR